MNAAADYFQNNRIDAYGDYCKVYSVTAKSHYLAHMALDAKYINPSLGWNFGGEDILGKFKICFQQAIVGNSMTQVLGKFCKMYKVGMHFQCSSCVAYGEL